MCVCVYVLVVSFRLEFIFALFCGGRWVQPELRELRGKKKENPAILQSCDPAILEATGVNAMLESCRDWWPLGVFLLFLLFLLCCASGFVAC